MTTRPAETSPERSARGARRLRVLEAAATALNHRGVSQTSLADIAREVGVSRAALYYYFEDQQDLVFQCYRRSCELMARRLNEASRVPGALAAVDSFIEGMLAEGAAEFAALSEAAYLRPDQRSTILGLYEAVMASLAEILSGGVARGELRACNVRIVAQAIVGLVCWVPMARRWRTSDPLSDRDLIDATKTLLHDGIAVDRRTPVRYRATGLAPPGLPAGQVFDAAAMATARQEALLAAASWLFNLKGIDATSLEEIALRLGVTKKVIYHNVGDKETLVVECFRRAFRFHEDVAARIAAYEGSRIEALCAGVHAGAEASLREDVTPLAPLAGFEALPEAIRDEIQSSAIRLMEAYLAQIARGQAEGSVRELPVRGVLAMQPGAIEWLPKWFEMMTPEERLAAPGELAELYRVGLRQV